MAHTLAMVVRARGRELRYCVVPTMFEPGNEGSVLGLRTLMQRFTDARLICSSYFGVFVVMVSRTGWHTFANKHVERGLLRCTHRHDPRPS